MNEDDKLTEDFAEFLQSHEFVFDEDEVSHPPQTLSVLEKDMRSIGDGFGFIFRVLGFGASCIGKGVEEAEKTSAASGVFHPIYSVSTKQRWKRHPDYPSAANPQWKL